MAIVSHNSARLLELLLARRRRPAGCWCRSTSGSRRRRSATSSSTPARGCCWSTPSSETIAQGRPRSTSTGSAPARSTSSCSRFDAEPRPWAEPDEDATATINYTSGTTARPKGVQMTHRNIWVNAVTFGMHMQVSDRDVYLHTLPMFHCNGWGMPYAIAGLGARQVVLRKVDGAEILRRVEQHGVTLMCGAPAVWNAVLDAAADVGRRDPRPRPGAHRRRRRAAAVAHDRAGRGRARLGVQPDLRPHRDRAAADDQPVRARSTTTSTPEERAQAAVPGRRPGAGHPAGRQRRRRGARAGQHRPRRLLGEPRGLGRGARRTAGSTPATAARSTTAAT